MGSYTVKQRFAQRILPLFTLIITAGTAYWLYQESPGLGGIQGIAEAKEHTVSSIVTGRLTSVEVAVGQRVSRDQILASLDKGVFEQEVRVADAELRELEAQVSATDMSLDLNWLEADRRFQSELETNEIELGETRAECTRIRAELAGLQKEISRQRELVKRQLASADQMHALQVRLNALQEAAGSCPSRVEALERNRKAAQQRLNEWRSRRGNDLDATAGHDQLQPLQLRNTRQQEYISLLKMRAENLVLRAPIDGYIAKVDATEGCVVIPGEPLIIIVEDNPQQIVAYLEEDCGYSVVPGDKAFMRPRDRAGVALEGTVASVARTVLQMPSRFWPAPNRPRWGRQVFIQTDANHSLDPGETFGITFKARNGLLDTVRNFVNAERPEKDPQNDNPLRVQMELPQ